MFRLFRFVFRTIATLKLLGLAFSAGMGAAFLARMWSQYRSWGLVPGAVERGLTGDDLVPQPDVTETRAIDIDVPPAQVWPWLAQLGYGRGGWYAYAALDRPWSPGGGTVLRSSDTILDEFQDLAEGDLVPTHPEGGFEAKVVEPGQALVLFLDDAMIRDQFDGMVADGGGKRATRGVELDMPPTQVSWAFMLEERPGGRTRLLERLRFRVQVSETQMRARPLLALGVFALMHSQMEGIKRRAEAQ